MPYSCHIVAIINGSKIMSGIVKKILKIVFYILLITVLFVAGASGIFIATFDANSYKQDLTDLVREQTGRELEFFGDVSLTVYPALGMQLGAMSFSNAAGFGAQSMIKVNKVSISVDVASLITFSPEVDQLLLQDLEINLQKNKAGKTNWDDLIKQDTKAATTVSESGTETSDSESGPIEFKGAFGGINMKNARLLWKDDQAGVEYRINDLDFTTGRITLDAPFDLNLQMALQTSDGVDVKFDLAGQIQYLINESVLNINNFELEVAAQGSLLPLGKIQIGFSSQSTRLDLQRGNVKLDGLELRIDDSRLNGSINVTDFVKPVLSYQLSSDLLDIDALLGTPPVAQQSEQSTVEAPVSEQAAAEDVKIELPMELLRSMQIDGQLSVKQVKLQNLILNDVELKTIAKNGVLKLDPIAMNLYDGSFQGSVQIDTRSKTPKYRVNKTLKGVQIGKLMIDFMGEERINGELAAKVEVSTSGEWLSALKKNSNGAMNLMFKDGAIKGFNLRYSIDRAKARLNKQPEPSEALQTTDFSALGLSGKIKNGVFSSSDLNLEAPLLRVGGEGKADLNENTVDYLIKAKLVGTVAGQAGGEAEELKGLLIPVRVKGPFASLDIDVQLDEMLRAAGQAKLQADIDRQKAELKKQLANEKAALEVAKQRELEKQKAVLEAKKAAEKQKLKDKLKKKLGN
jgi:AsmA protein